MLNIPIDTTPRKRKSHPLLYVRRDQHQRLNAIAEHYDLPMVEIIERCLIALEADMNGKEPQS